MKRWTHLYSLQICAVLVYSIGLGLCGALAQGSTSDAPSKQPRVAIVDGVLSINETKVSLPAPRQELVKLLGKPTRESKLASTILTWDALGIAVYMDPKTNKCTAINFSLKKEAFDFSPKRAFAGTITVNGTKITEASTIKEVNAATKGRQFTLVDRDISDWWETVYPTATVFIESASPSKEGLVYLQLDTANK